jgi:hypothetical protein
MNDQAKLALHDAFVAYLLQSSKVMDATARALASDPLQADKVDVLDESLGSAKVLLSKIILSCSYPELDIFS